MELRGAIAFALTLAAGLLLGRPLIAALRSLSAKQIAYEDAPKTHQAKTGTPTMGGVLFPLAAVVAAIAAPTSVTLALALLMVACAGIGAVDDFMGIRFGRNRGLRARTKFLLTGLAAAFFLYVLLGGSDIGRAAIFGLGVRGPVVFAILSLCVVVATTHAVNLTDGLDGLAAGSIVPPLAVIAFIAYAEGKADVGVFELATLGVVVAFLAYNRHPARMFMGDTGSLALGAALAGGAIATGMQLILLIIGGVFAVETLSVIVQVISYKTTKRRVFRMSPLHHHFELGGWPETKVTTRFWFASLICSLAGCALVTVRT